MSPTPAGEARTGAHVTVYGERFNVDVDEDGVWVQHPKWSLVGNGPSLYDAEVDLHWEAKRLAEHIHDDDPADWGDEGRQMQDYVVRNFLASNPPDRRTGPKDRRSTPRYDRRKGGQDGK